METELDSSYTWFFEKVKYENTLKVWLLEGIQRPKEEILIGESSLGLGNKIETSKGAKIAIIEFSSLLSWHCIDESATTYNKGEISEGGKFLNTLSKAAYLEYVKSECQWYIDINSPVKQYRIWTENEIIEVVAYTPPTLEIRHA